MKLKTTKKAIKNSGKRIIKIGYCGLQNLLANENPFAYSSGSGGWSCDYFEFDKVIISIGYQPIGEGISYDKVREFDLKAKKIRCNYDLKYVEQKEQINILLKEFLLWLESEVK